MASPVWVGGKAGWDYLTAADSGHLMAGSGVAGLRKNNEQNVA